MTAAAEGGAGAGPAASASRTSAGAKLRSAREAQGLTVDAVAQQLKLAPRQVQALEGDDYGRLPGRTFVRGFARNYARLVHLDPDAIVALLPTADAAPALERPGLGPVRRPMGELPVERASRRSVLRWFVPLVLLVIVATAGYYEYLRQHGMLHPAGRGAGTTTRDDTGAGASRATGTAPATEPAVLPNPLAGRDAAEAGAPSKDGAPPQSAAATTEPGPALAPGAGTEPGSATSPEGTPPPSAAASPSTAAAPGAAAAPALGGTNPSGAPAKESSAGTIIVAPPAGPPAGNAAAPLVLTFNGASWVEVRDASGRVILKATEAAGTTRSVDGNPPFQVTLGDAPKVSVTFRGQPLDLGPHTRGDVARVTLK